MLAKFEGWKPLWGLYRVEGYCLSLSFEAVRLIA